MRIFFALIFSTIAFSMAEAISFDVILEIKSDTGGLRYWLNNREVTQPALTNKLAYVAASFGSNQIVHLLCNTNVSAPGLLQTIADIQKSGLHSIILVSPDSQHGTNGFHQVNVNCSKWSFDYDNLSPESLFQSGLRTPSDTTTRIASNTTPCFQSTTNSH